MAAALTTRTTLPLGRCQNQLGFAPRVSTVVARAVEAPVAVDVRPQNLQEALELSKRFNTAFSTSQYVEYAYAVDKIEGTLPAGLKGTLLRNGPGLFEVGNAKIAQPFDGDGLVSSLALDGQGNVHFTNKFVRTQGFVKERRAGKQLYRSAFNRSLPEDQGLRITLPFVGTITVANPLDLDIKDVANTNVLRWAGKTLALYERGLPHALSTPDLNTEGTDTLGDTLAAPYLAAHLRLLEEADGSKRAVMFSTSESGMDAVVTCYEYGQDFALLHRTQAKLPGAAFGFFHDIAVSSSYYVLLENPMRMDMAKLLTKVPFAQASIAECLTFNPDVPAKLHLIPRPGSGVTGGVRSYDVPGPGFFTFHHGNAYEINADGSTGNPGAPARYLVLDSCSAGKVDFSLNALDANAGYYSDPKSRVEQHRIVVDLTRPVHPSAITRTCIVPRSCEFPSVAPGVVGKPHSHTYLASSSVQGGNFFGPNQILLKTSVDPLNGVGKDFDRAAVKQTVWSPGSRHEFPGEPVFVPRSLAHGDAGSGDSAEDDGWIMSMVYNSQEVKSFLLILDAKDMTEVARVHLNHHMPAGLHGMFTPEYLGPAPGTANATPYDIRNGV